MKTVINLNEEEQQFIRGLLSDTREQFAQAFRDLAKSESKKDRRKFVAYRVTLTELIVPRPMPVHMTEDKQKGGNDENP